MSLNVLVCPVRPGDDNEELRYALRSWEANLIGAAQIPLWVVGHCPRWLQPDVFILGNRFKSAPLAIFDNIRLATEEAVEAGVEEYLLMNDDFFCMYPTYGVPVVHRGMTLAEHAALAGPAGSDHWYPRALRETSTYLREQEMDTTSYEVHSPLPVTPRAMHAALSMWRDHNPATFEFAPLARSLYGNGCNFDAEYAVEDCKLGTNSIGMGTPWISTSDQAWRRFRASLVRRFRKPSRWEREPD